MEHSASREDLIHEDHGESSGDLIHEDHGESSGDLIHEDHFAVDIKNLDEELVSSMKEKMESASPSLCIYKVPENLRKSKETSYRPEIISIGPFHYRKEGLKGMEEHKWQYLRALLIRKANLEAGIDDCVKAIRQLEQRARKCYEDSISLSSNEFVEMMILDGCFIIELFLKYASKGLRRRGDPIFNKNWMLFSLRSDMILLENQLPLFVLQRLFELIPVPKQCDQTLDQLVFRFFKLIIPGDKEVLQKKFSQEGSHLLDLILNCHLPTLPRVPAKQNGSHKNINSAEKLKESGVKLKKVKEMSDSLLDIMFVNGVLELPPLQVHNYTETMFRNLIALEHCYKDCPMYVTSYALFMGGLIQSPKDVQLLRKRGIVTNCLGNDDVVMSLFKRLCNEVIVQDYYYAGICGQVNAYDGRTNKCSQCF